MGGKPTQQPDVVWVLFSEDDPPTVACPKRQHHTLNSSLEAMCRSALRADRVSRISEPGVFVFV
jgi:hypothetical protein